MLYLPGGFPCLEVLSARIFPPIPIPSLIVIWKWFSSFSKRAPTPTSPEFCSHHYKDSCLSGINGENDFFRTAQALLNAGADVNGLGNDESDLSRLRFTIEVYCLRPHCQMPYTFSEFEEEIIANHLMEWSYDSPLRIVDRGIRKTARRGGGNLNRLREMEELLLSHGAKSLHRSLIRYPPTYIQARISEHLVSRGYNRFRHKITQKIRATS